VLTDEGAAFFPTLSDAFERLAGLLEQLEGGRRREVLTVSAVGTFVVGWLLERLPTFREQHPFVDLRLLTNNNKPDLAGEGLDFAIRFGDGAWQGIEAVPLVDTPLAPLCAPQLSERLAQPRDLLGVTLLRSYRPQDWQGWFESAGLRDVTVRGPMFDSSWLMVQVALRGEGVALAPPLMFRDELASGRLVQPFPTTVRTGAYWLTRLRSRPETTAMTSFRQWLTNGSDPD